MTIEVMWEKFRKICPTAKEYEAWSYGSAPDQLLDLTMKGIKTATASAYQLYQLDQEKVPEVGDYSILLNSQGEACCIIQTTKVTIVPYREVTEEQAYLEGEGDRTLRYWREVHEEFFRGELEPRGLEFTEEILVVYEQFKVVYR